MYVIAKQADGYRAIPVRCNDKWNFRKVLPGRTEVRIVFRIRGRQYLLYHTRELSKTFPTLKRPQLILLCNEIIEILSEQITNEQEYIQFERVATAVELRHRRSWIAKGLIPMDSLTEYHGHPIDPKAEIMTTHVNVDLSDIILMDHEPPIDVEVEQEELPY